MPRVRKSRLFPIALSPEALSEAVGLHKRIIRKAIRDGALPVLKIGAKRRVLVCDAVEFLRTTYQEQRP